MSKLLIPNTTQMPNILVDEVMPKLNETSLRVLVAIVRKTYGFQKPTDTISITQFEKLTGLSRQGVVDGIAGLGDLINVKRNGTNEYSLNLDISTGQLVNHFDHSADQLVNDIDQSNNLTSQNRTFLGSQQGRHTKPIKNKTKKSGALQKSKKPNPKIPDDIQSAVSKIIARINELGGTHYRDDKPGPLKNLLQKLTEGRTEAECLAVVENRHSTWNGDRMMEYFRPSTLFADSHFDDYLQQAYRGSSGNAAGDNWFSELQAKKAANYE